MNHDPIKGFLFWAHVGQLDLLIKLWSWPLAIQTSGIRDMIQSIFILDSCVHWYFVGTGYG